MIATVIGFLLALFVLVLAVALIISPLYTLKAGGIPKNTIRDPRDPRDPAEWY